MRKINKTITAILGLLLISFVTMGAKIGENELRLGKGTDVDIEIKANNGDTNLPILKYNSATNTWQAANDGVSFNDLGSTTIVDPVEFNHVSNPGAEINTDGWVTYADAAASTPVDGTGGSPTTTLTRITSNQLRDNGSFRITKDAANRQGEGVSFDFTIDTPDLGKKVEILLEFEQSVNYADDDIQIFIHNNDTPGLVTTELQNLKDGAKVFKTQFIADATDVNYRLIFHIASTNANAYTLDFDNVKVRPAHAVVGLVKSGNVQQLRLEFFTVINPGTGAVSLESSDWINGNCTVNGTGDNSCTIIAGIFSSAPICGGICRSTTGCGVQMHSAATAIAIRYLVFDFIVPSATNDTVVIWCLGPTT